MEALNFEYKPEEWRLFIDASVNSLKAVLLFFDNSKMTVPLAMGTDTNESHEKMQLILNTIKYEDHQWMICADLKIVNLLTGLKGGWSKYSCFLCEWDTRWVGKNHYQRRDWPLRTELIFKQKGVDRQTLVPMDKVLLPPLHIKLGIVKSFIKALDYASNAFKRLEILFPALNKGFKLREGIR